MPFYGSQPLAEAPLLEIPAHQYGPLPSDPQRGNFSLLEPIRPFLWGAYRYLGVVVPRASVILANNPDGLNALQQISDVVTLPPRSWLVGFRAYSAQAAGFGFSVFDVGAGDYALNEQFASNQAGAQDNTDSDPAIPHILPVPYCLVSPGTLQIKLVNSASVSNDCQLVLDFAIPGGKQ